MNYIAREIKAFGKIAHLMRINLFGLFFGK